MAWIYRAQNGNLMFSKTKPEKVYRFKFRNDIAKYIVDKCIDEGYILPQFASQSANPVGRENILGLLNGYKEFIKS